MRNIWGGGVKEEMRTLKPRGEFGIQKKKEKKRKEEKKRLKRDRERELRREGR